MSELKELLAGSDSDEDDPSEEKEEISHCLTTSPPTNSWVGGLRQRAKTYRDKLMSNKFAVASQFVVCSNVLSDTVPSRNCDILVTIPDSTDDDVVMWLVTRLRARVPELVLHLRHHSKTKEYGLYLTASNENLLRGAEELSLKKQVKKEYGGGFKEFVYEDRDYFQGISDGRKSFLKSEERQSIVRHLLMNLRAEDGDELVRVSFHEGQAIVPILLSRGVVTQILPMHSCSDLGYLRKEWVKTFFHKQPLDSICDYFGVKIAMYFAYLGYYTKCLLWPAAIGFVFWFLGGSHQYTDDICFVAFAFFNVVWATFYLEGWKSVEAIHAFRWGTMDKEDELLVEPRALYHGEIKKSQVTGRFEPSYPIWKRNLFRYFVSIPVIFVCLTVVFVVVWTILELQFFINSKVEDDKVPYFFKFIPKVILAVCISVLNGAYKKIATWLNDKENHRLDETYEKNLIIKLILFQSVNAFFSLFYIAFYLRNMTQLQEQLGALLITRQVIGNLKSTIQPFVVEKVRLFRYWYQLVVSLGPEVLQDRMRKMSLRRKKGRKRSDSVSESASESEGKCERVSSSTSLEDLDALSEIPDDFLSRGSGPTVGDGRPKWTTGPIESIREEEEEEEEEEECNEDMGVILEEDEMQQTDDESKEKLCVPQLVLPIIVEDKVADDEENKIDDNDEEEEEEEEEEEDYVPEMIIRDSRTAVPGGFLGRKRGFGIQRYTGQRKISMMVDVKNQLPQLKLISKKNSTSKMSQAEVESVMKRYEDTYQDYLEMFIQFGYVTLFSPAFPLAALCAFLNNIIEMRSDAFKLCVSLQRPFGQRVENIGIWQKALELMSIMAVMVNSALIGMSGLAERMFPDWGTVERIIFIVILEHFVLGLKLLMANAIPEVPSEVAEEKARLEFLRREALKNICARVNQPRFDVDDNVKEVQSYLFEKISACCSNVTTEMPRSEEKSS